MVSASHNPADDNGLKVVSGGRKVDDEVEEQLERLIFQAEALPGRQNAELGRLGHDTAPVAAYRAHLVECGRDALRGLRIGLDCANGSAAVIAPDLFRELGAEVTVINAEPDGTNINLDAGSSHPQGLAELVVRGAAGHGLRLRR